MADVKISELDPVTAVNDADLIPVVQSGVTMQATREQLRGYKIYVASISQVGTNAPTAVILENSLGEDPTFTYITAKNYGLIVQTSLFINGKTMLTPQLGFNYPNQVLFSRIDNTSLSIQANAGDSQIANHIIEIRVYP